jgi:hypothetical protein
MCLTIIIINNNNNNYNNTTITTTTAHPIVPSSMPSSLHIMMALSPSTWTLQGLLLTLLTPTLPTHPLIDPHGIIWDWECTLISKARVRRQSIPFIPALTPVRVGINPCLHLMVGVGVVEEEDMEVVLLDIFHQSPVEQGQ